MNTITQFWIALCAFASLAGWGLSTVGQLNRAGYAIAFAVAALIGWAIRRNRGAAAPPCPAKLLRRFRRPLPLAFLILAALVFAGAAIYPPTNYSGLQYRTARVLQWLAHDGWWWIHSPNYRMNDRACGYEWMLAPLLTFTKSDRLLFLVNFIPFLLMPGLIFSVFTRLGVRPRVAWQWMWLLPTGYNFLLQAGSIANDTFPAVFALAAVDFALRARASAKISDVWYSMIAAALLTGAKAGNLPLLLPWAIAIFPSLPQSRPKLSGTIVVATVALAVSFVPTAILNAHYCGDWSGASLEDPQLAMKHPLTGAWGNALILLFNNFLPPLFPMAGWWNQHGLATLPSAISSAMVANFEQGFQTVGELPTEDLAGIGFGLSLLLLVSVGANGFGKKGSPLSTFRFSLLLSPWLSLLFFCAKSGMVTPQRLIAPYYPLLIAALVAGPGPAQIVRRSWWKGLVLFTLLLALVVLVLSPDRPLWPAKTILSRVAARHPDQHLVQRALNVYTTYARRSDPLADVRALLPPHADPVGFIAGADDMDISLWQPLGHRTVKHFFLTDPPEQLHQVQYAVVGGANLKASQVTLDDWLQKNGAAVIGSTNATLKINEGAQPWYVVQFRQ